MSKAFILALLAFVCVIAYASAQGETTTTKEYLPYYFKIPITSSVTADTLTGTDCAPLFPVDPPADAANPVTPWSFAYIANGYVYTQYRYLKQATDEDVPSYLFVARSIKNIGNPTPEDTTADYSNPCFKALNPDVATWQRYYETKCQRPTCGGSSICGCASGQACKFAGDETKLSQQDFCVSGFLCKGTIPATEEPETSEPENPPAFSVLDASTGLYDGVCKYRYSTYKLVSAGGFDNWSTKFEEIAANASCSPYQLMPTYALRQNDEIYFQTPLDDTISSACITLLTDEFGGDLEVNSVDACKSTCGGDKSCLCGQDNSCTLSLGDSQCESGLKCQLVGGLPICNNALFASTTLALIAVVAAFF